MQSSKKVNMASVMRFVSLCTLLCSINACQINPESFFPLKASPVCHGQDILGLARQDVNMISNNWDDGECLGVLAGTFGGTIKPVKKVISENVVPAVRWHLSFCNHGSQCLKGECLPTDLNCMKKKAKDINTLHSQFPQTKCYISPRLEYTENNCAKVQSWFSAVDSVAPLCTLVASPLFGSCIPSEVLVERHGNKPQNVDVVSNDGDNYFDSDSVGYNKLGKVLNLKWTNRYNLRLTSEHEGDEVLPPRQRPLSNRIEKKDFKQMQMMKNTLPPMPHPAFCGNFRQLQNNELWKNHSEDYGASNPPSGNKPLWIGKDKRDQLPVYDVEGHKIACVKYYGPYENLHRHYMGTCSGDHPIDLYKKAKGEWAFIKDGNTCIGIPTIRRWGYYH